MRGRPSGDISLGAHQCRDMDGGRARQSIEVVAAFERRDELAAGVLCCRLEQLLGHPGEVVLEQSDLR